MVALVQRHGIGMTVETIKAFLNLSDSAKPDVAQDGMVRRRMTGYKGHGTKVYFNSEFVEVLTRRTNETPVYCGLADPHGQAWTALRPPPKSKSYPLLT